MNTEFLKRRSLAPGFSRRCLCSGHRLLFVLVQSDSSGISSEREADGPPRAHTLPRLRGAALPSTHLEHFTDHVQAPRLGDACHPSRAEPVSGGPEDGRPGLGSRPCA